jgi:hypothetical protein
MHFVHPNILKKIIFWGAIHFIATLGAVFASLEALGHFDDPSWEPSLLYKFGNFSSEILLFPAQNVMSSTRGLSDFFEWVITIGGSLLWGAAITAAIFFWQKRRQ